MGVVTGIVSAPFKLIKGVGNRYRIAIHENRIDDQISPENGISGFIFDKVEDVTNFVTLGAVVRLKDGIKTKGYGSMSGEEMDQALTEQYAANVASSAEKKAEKQQRKWDKLEEKMDKLSASDQLVDLARQRAANAAAMVGDAVSVSDESELSM